MTFLVNLHPPLLTKRNVFVVGSLLLIGLSLVVLHNSLSLGRIIFPMMV